MPYWEPAGSQTPRERDGKKGDTHLVVLGPKLLRTILSFLLGGDCHLLLHVEQPDALPGQNPQLVVEPQRLEREAR